MKIQTYILTIFLMFLNTYIYGQINITELERAESGRWTKIGNTKPYSGDFIEYFSNNKIKGKGTLKNGLVEGYRVVFLENGDTAFYRYYSQGIKNGQSKEFFTNNKVKQEGKFIDDKEDDTWKFYYENGNPHEIVNFKKGVQDGDYIEYNMDGTLRAKYVYKNGKATYGKEIDDLVNKALKYSQKWENEKAIELYDNAIAINPSIAQLYFNRGTCKLNIDKKYLSDAIKDFDKAIELNPNYLEAYANRGNAKINQFTRNGILKPNSEQTKGACEDFQKAKELGDQSIGTEDMIYIYCGGLTKEKK